MRRVVALLAFLKKWVVHAGLAFTDDVVSMRIRSHGYSSDTLPDIPDISGRISCGQPPEFPHSHAQ